MKEVELKVYVGREKGAVLEALAAKFKLKRASTESDVYYTSKFKDFIGPEECLRIRTRDGVSELTWKPPTTTEMLDRQQYWKQELNIDLGAQALLMREMLTNLDFIEYVVVEKDRHEFSVDNATTVTVDELKGVGVFVEVETMCEDAELGTAKNTTVLNSLQLPTVKRVSRPYRDIAKDGRFD